MYWNFPPWILSTTADLTALRPESIEIFPVTPPKSLVCASRSRSLASAFLRASAVPEDGAPCSARKPSGSSEESRLSAAMRMPAAS